MRTLARLAALVLLPALLLLPAVALGAPDGGAWVDPSGGPAAVLAPPQQAASAMPLAVAIISAILGFISLLNRALPPTPAGQSPSTGRLILDVLSLLAMREHTGIAGPVNLPFFRSSRKPSIGGPAALVFLVAIPLLSACHPLPPCSPADAKCTLEQNLIACGEQSGYQILPSVLSWVIQAIAGNPSPAALVTSLESQGFQDVPCVLAALESYLLPAAPQAAKVVHDALVVALARSGRHGSITIRLHSGRELGAVVP